MKRTNVDYCGVCPIFTLLHEVGNNLYRITEFGGMVAAVGKNGESGVVLAITEHGGAVTTFDRYGQSKVLD